MSFMNQIYLKDINIPQDSELTDEDSIYLNLPKDCPKVILSELIVLRPKYKNFKGELEK